MKKDHPIRKKLKTNPTQSVNAISCVGFQEIQKKVREEKDKNWRKKSEK